MGISYFETRIILQKENIDLVNSRENKNFRQSLANEGLNLRLYRDAIGGNIMINIYISWEKLWKHWTKILDQTRPPNQNMIGELHILVLIVCVLAK